jgi:DNA-binding transcriptional MocR family regulator
MDLSVFVGVLASWSTPKGALNRKLALAIQQGIASGAVAPGARLPAERSLARALAISRSTVVSAYAALCDSGWLESRRGSGTYVRAGSRVVHAARESSQARALAASPLFTLMAHDQESAINLAIGTPYPLRLPKKSISLAPADEETILCDRLYHPQGLPRLRQAIAARFSRTGLKTSVDQILVTNGAQQAISLIASLYLQRGDTALVEDPTYFGAIEAFRACGARVSSMPVGRDGVSPAILRERMSATAPRLVYLTPTYQNPTGAVMPESSRRAVARLARETGVPVLDDSSLADIVLEGGAPPPIAAFGDPGEVLTAGSISKLIWSGLRAGWIRASPPVIERLARIKTSHDLGSPLWTQAIAAQLIEGLPEAQRLRREELRPRRALLAGLLKKHLPDWTFRIPSGGFFLWVRLPAGDSREVAQVALRHGVVILPGTTMSAAGLHARFVRIPFLADPETLNEGIGRLSAAWREYQHVPRRMVAEAAVTAIT